MSTCFNWAARVMIGELRLVEVYDKFMFFCSQWANTEIFIKIYQDLVNIYEF